MKIWKPNPCKSRPFHNVSFPKLQFTFKTKDFRFWLYQNRVAEIAQPAPFFCSSSPIPMNASTPSEISPGLFVGCAVAARSVHTLQHLGITHILSLRFNEIGQSDSQFPELFEYRNFPIYDYKGADISDIFQEAHDFIDNVEQIGGKVLVHCFGGKIRTATMVMAYLMLRKNFTLLEAWNAVKVFHRSADVRILLDLDRKLHGRVSMEQQRCGPIMKVVPIRGKDAGLSNSSSKLHLKKAQKKPSSGGVDSAMNVIPQCGVSMKRQRHRRPTMKVCLICGENAGLSNSSLKLHLKKSHKKLSSDGVDGGMTMEIQKALDALEISRGGIVSPTQKQTHSTIDESCPELFPISENS